MSLTNELKRQPCCNLGISTNQKFIEDLSHPKVEEFLKIIQEGLLGLQGANLDI